MDSRFLAECVERGGHLLDQRYPGWWKLIVKENLDLEHCKHCILGQLDNDYFYVYHKWNNLAGTSEYGYNNTMMVFYGFQSPISYTEDQSKMCYSHLRIHWLREIEKRELAEIADADIVIPEMVTV